MIAHFAVCVPIEHSWQVNPYPGGKYSINPLEKEKIVTDSRIDNCVLRRPNQALVGVLNIL